MTAAPSPHGAIVTGAARGIGLAIARRLVSDGYTVVGIDLDESVSDSMEAAGATGVTADVNDEGAMVAVADRASEVGDGIAAFVANAGIWIPGDSVDYPLAHWDNLMEVNMRAAFIGARVVAPQMGTGGGIVMVSSISASLGFGGRAAYCASKAGVEGMVRALAVEWGPTGIRVNAVAPGTTATEMQRTMVGSGRSDNEALLSRIPLRRVGEVDDIAGAVSFLLSGDAAYMTGAVLPVDGGWSAAGLPSYS